MTHDLEQKQFYVYADLGVGAESLAETLAFFGPNSKNITAEAIQTGSWVSQASALIIPGGEDIPYAEKLNGLGNQIIRKYVQEGGVYIGICAGAYYACSQLEFDLGISSEIRAHRELGFFKGKAVGPVQKGPHWVYVNHHLFYLHDGPYFESADQYPEVNILGYYESGQAAILQIPIGSGFAILSGVHFEKYNF